MAKERNWSVFIPIVLNLLTLLVYPSFIESASFLRATLVTLFVLVWPWILYFVIGRIIHHIVEKSAAKREEAEDRDFV